MAICPLGTNGKPGKSSLNKLKVNCGELIGLLDGDGLELLANHLKRWSSRRMFRYRKRNFKTIWQHPSELLVYEWLLRSRGIIIQRHAIEYRSPLLVPPKFCYLIASTKPKSYYIRSWNVAGKLADEYERQVARDLDSK